MAIRESFQPSHSKKVEVLNLKLCCPGLSICAVLACQVVLLLMASQRKNSAFYNKILLFSKFYQNEINYRESCCPNSTTLNPVPIKWSLHCPKNSTRLFRCKEVWSHPFENELKMTVSSLVKDILLMECRKTCRNKWVEFSNINHHYI